VDRETATRIFTVLHRFAETGEGDVKKLKGKSDELRLRVGDYRVALPKNPTTASTRHRKDTYR